MVRRRRHESATGPLGVGAINPRYVEDEAQPEGGGLEGFESPEARTINEARLAHLASMALPLAGHLEDEDRLIPIVQASD